MHYAYAYFTSKFYIFMLCEIICILVQGLSISMVVFNILKLLLGYGPLPGIDESFDKVCT